MSTALPMRPDFQDLLQFHATLVQKASSNQVQLIEHGSHHCLLMGKMKIGICLEEVEEPSDTDNFDLAIAAYLLGVFTAIRQESETLYEIVLVELYHPELKPLLPFLIAA